MPRIIKEWRAQYDRDRSRLPHRIALRKKYLDKRSLEENRERMQQYRITHPGYAQFHKHLRKQRLSNAAPKWLTAKQLKQIEWFYVESCRLTAETGVQYSVDHIEPLKGKDRCGLHVPWNLRVIPLADNVKKFISIEETP